MTSSSLEIMAALFGGVSQEDVDNAHACAKRVSDALYKTENAEIFHRWD